MSDRRAVRVIAFRGNQILVMKHNRFGNEYYTLIGGGIDAGEDADQAIVREVKEETGLVLTNARLVMIEDSGDPFGIQYIYAAGCSHDEPVLAKDSEEALNSKMGKNTYTPMWLDIESFKDCRFFSDVLKISILQGMKTEFAGEIKNIQSNSKVSYNS